MFVLTNVANSNRDGLNPDWPNPRTGAAVKIDASNKLVFQPAKALTDALAG